MSTPPIPPLPSVPVHEGIEEWMAADLTDGLTEEERRLFAEHLAGCARCRDLFAEETAMSQTLQDAFDDVRPLPGFEQRLTAAFRHYRERAFGERLRRWAGNLWARPAVRVLGGVAAALGLIVLGDSLTGERPWIVVQYMRQPVAVPTTDVDMASQLGEPEVRELVAGVNALEFTSGGHAAGPAPQRGAVAARSTPATESASAGKLATEGQDQSQAEQAKDSDFNEYANTRKKLHSLQDRSVTDSSTQASKPLTLEGTNTYTGGATAGGGTLSLLNGRRILSSTIDGARYTGTAGFGDDKTPVTISAQYGSNVPLTGTGVAVARRDATGQANNKDPQSFNLAGAPVLDGKLASGLDAMASKENAAVAGEPAQPSPAPAPAAPTPEARKLIRNASVELEAAAFDPAVDALGAAASQVGGGYVATVDSVRLPNGKRRGTVVLKVLPDRLDAFLARLHELGEIKSQTVAAQDVTKDYFDTEARMRNDRRMEDRLLKLLDDAKGKLSDILQVEKELARVREGIEKAQGELQLFDALVRYATVTVSLYEKDLQQPAAFLLRQTADLFLLAPDVERTYADARRIAADAHAQIVSSDLARGTDGRVSGTLHLILAPENADAAVAQLKGLARVQYFTVHDQRVAQNGSPDAGADADRAKTERGPVTCDVTIRHDEETGRSVSLSLTAADPAAAFDKARAAGLAAGGEITQASFNRTTGAHGSGTLGLRLPAQAEASLLDTVRGLGRTSHLDVQRSGSTATNAEPVLVAFTLNVADEPVRRRVSLTLVAPDLDAAFDKARSAVLAQGGEITDSSFDRPQGGHGSARLLTLLPGEKEAAVLAAVRALGRASFFKVERHDASPDEDPARGPVALEMNFADEEVAAQRTSASVRCGEVDKKVSDLRRAAADAGAQTRASTLEQNTDGSEVASLTFRLPLRAYPGFIARVQGLGEVKELTVHREDRPERASAQGEADDTAPAEVSVRLYSQGRLVGDESGAGATLRRTLAQGAAALTWSLRMIGVALAFLAPWLVAGALAVWLGQLIARRRKAAPAKGEDPAA